MHKILETHFLISTRIHNQRHTKFHLLTELSINSRLCFQKLFVNRKSSFQSEFETLLIAKPTATPCHVR